MHPANTANKRHPLLLFSGKF